MEVHDGWNRVSAYQAIKNGGSTNIAIPSALCRTYGQSSYLGIANPADSAVSFKVQFQPLSGPVTIRSHLVRAHGRIGLSTCQQIGNTPWFGSASISETTGLLSVISKVTRDDGNPDAEGSVEGISVEEAEDETGDTLALPYVRWTQTLSNTRPRTSIAVQNLSNTTPVPVWAKYYDRDGILRGTHYLGSLAPLAKANTDPSMVGLNEFGYENNRYGGSVIIKGPGGSKLAAIARVFGQTTTEDYKAKKKKKSEEEVEVQCECVGIWNRQGCPTDSISTDAYGWGANKDAACQECYQYCSDIATSEYGRKYGLGTCYRNPDTFIRVNCEAVE
jgi:hypothetical protein